MTVYRRVLNGGYMTTMRVLGLAALLYTSQAQAAINTIDFSGYFDSGAFKGETYQGFVSYDSNFRLLDGYDRYVYYTTEGTFHLSTSSGTSLTQGGTLSVWNVYGGDYKLGYSEEFRLYSYDHPGSPTQSLSIVVGDNGGLSFGRSSQYENYSPFHARVGLMDKGRYSESVTTSTLINSSAVPEPDTWTLMILGFGLIGTFARRDRARVRFAVSAC